MILIKGYAACIKYKKGYQIILDNNILLMNNNITINSNKLIYNFKRRQILKMYYKNKFLYFTLLNMKINKNNNLVLYIKEYYQKKNFKKIKLNKNYYLKNNGYDEIIILINNRNLDKIRTNISKNIYLKMILYISLIYIFIIISKKL